MKKHLKNILFFLLSAILISYGYIEYNALKMPQNYYIYDTDISSFNMFPFYIDIKKHFNKEYTEKTKPVFSNGNCNTCYSAELKFLNFLPLKTVQVNAIPHQKVIPCGTPCGVKIYTDGVVVIGISEVYTSNGPVCPAQSCDLKKGDIITKINSQPVKTNEELEKIIENSEGKKLQVSAIRNEKNFETFLKAEKSCDDNKYRAGIWVRDSSAGIGTLTFKNKNNMSFGGLGHGICDVDTGKILPLYKGEIIEATISSVQKGYKGSPGELKGNFINSNSLGQISSNTNIGLYGALKNPLEDNNSEIEVALKQDVKKGPAKLLTTIDGSKPDYYDIHIDSINYNHNLPTQNIKISVTDSRLLEKTGGIVQGMSGSPIIQNNKLIGAVTHVLVNNPNKGYAIFAETMVTNSNKIIKSEYKKLK